MGRLSSLSSISHRCVGDTLREYRGYREFGLPFKRVGPWQEAHKGTERQKDTFEMILAITILVRRFASYYARVHGETPIPYGKHPKA